MTIRWVFARIRRIQIGSQRLVNQFSTFLYIPPLYNKEHVFLLYRGGRCNKVIKNNFVTSPCDWMEAGDLDLPSVRVHPYCHLVDHTLGVLARTSRLYLQAVQGKKTPPGKDCQLEYPPSFCDGFHDHISIFLVLNVQYYQFLSQFAVGESADAL